MTNLYSYNGRRLIWAERLASRRYQRRKAKTMRWYDWTTNILAAVTLFAAIWYGAEALHVYAGWYCHTLDTLFGAITNAQKI